MRFGFSAVAVAALFMSSASFAAGNAGCYDGSMKCIHYPGMAADKIKAKCEQDMNSFVDDCAKAQTPDKKGHVDYALKAVCKEKSEWTYIYGNPDKKYDQKMANNQSHCKGNAELTK